MENISVPKGDYGYNLALTVNDADEAAYDLTDYTATLKVWSPGVPGTLLIDSGCSIVSAADGTITYTVASGDFDTVGSYQAEIELTKAGVVESTRPFKIIVTESG